MTHLPWQSPNGRFSALKLLVFTALFIPVLWLGWRWAASSLGSRPLMEALHQVGLWAIRFLWLSLLVSPARTLLRWPELTQLRRILGLAAFFYALLHVTLYVVDQKFVWGKIAGELLFNVYLTIGFTGFLALLALALTSSYAAIRRLGRKRWQNLHYAAYGIGALAIVHFLLQSKLDITEAALMAGFFIWLMLFRALRTFSYPLRRFSVLLALAVASGMLTALAEAGWYAGKTGVMVQRVLTANLDLHFGPRPAVWVLCCSLAWAGAAWWRADKSSPPLPQ